MSKTYIYTGDEVEKHFPTLGKTLNPGDEVTTDVEVNHPELTEKVKSKSQEKREEAQK